MDFFTHALLGYSIGFLMDRSRYERAALVMGAVIPDIDSFLIPLVYFFKWLYPLSHRGATHSLFIAPLLAIAGLYVASKTRLPWDLGESLRYSPVLALYAVLGAMSHLSLDMVTITGVPLLYPVTRARFAYELFFFSEPLVTLAALLIVLGILRERMGVVETRRALAVLLLLIVVVAGFRLAVRPTGDQVYPTHNPLRWWVVEDEGMTTRVYEYTYPGGELRPTVRFEEPVLGSEAWEAVERARATPEYAYFTWNSLAQPRAEVTHTSEGYIVQFADPLRTAALRKGGLGTSLRQLGLDGVAKFFVGEKIVVIDPPLF